MPKNWKTAWSEKRNNPDFIRPDKEKQCITVSCCYGADGKVILPMIIYSYKQFPRKCITSSSPDGFLISHSESGWMITTTYNTYIL